jgi:raffinose/stachyose/melibiose transport system permease protein
LGAIFLVFVIAFSLLPFLWAIVSSFKTNGEILSSAFSFPRGFRWENYVMAFKYSPLATYFINSVIITLITIVIGLLIFSMSAYVFAKFIFRLRGPLYSIISLTLLIPPTAIIFPIYLFINKIGLYNTKMGLVLVYLAVCMPSVLYVLRSFFLTIPTSIGEAASIDGAGFAGIFFQIILPLALPGLSTATVLIFLAAWNDFLYALMLTSGNNARTMPVALAQFLSMYGSNYGQLFAASTIVVIPSVILFLVLQKKVETALIAGAVKG